jgi:cobalamin biosynthesis Mg chelatase CobN
MADSAGFDKNLPIVKTNPDPTEAVKEALTLAIKNLSEKITGQFDANSKAVVLARDELAAQLSAMVISSDGKFAANKDLVDQLAKANAVALTAALNTQKESAAKSESATDDKIKQLQTAQDAANKTTNEKIDRLTSRMDTGEGRGFGTTESKQDRSTDKGQMLTIITIGIALAALVLALMGHIKP